MFKFENVYKEIYIFLLIIALCFYFLIKMNLQHLISIIVVLLLMYVYNNYLEKLSITKDTNITSKENVLGQDIKERIEISTDSFYVDKFPKQMKYIVQNTKMMDILLNIRFVRKFNKSIYSDISLYMNKLMKVYIYILSDRYDAKLCIPIFIDLTDKILELMNSLIIIVPQKMKHTYGLDTFKEVEKSIKDFTNETQKMLGILTKYTKIHLNEVYIIDTKYRPYEERKINV